MKTTGRRSFLALAGGSAGLAHWLGAAVTRAQTGAGSPKRLVIIHRPNGSIKEDFIRNNAPGPILAPFSDVWSWGVALKGVNVRPSSGSTGGSHEAGLVTLMTGGRLGDTYRTNDDYRSTAESLDQTLLKKSPLLKGARVGSVQAGAHGEQDGGNEIPNTALSYAGAAMPIYPTLKPSDVYTRLFGGQMLPGGGTAANLDLLRKARLRKQSVLDFVRWDVARVRAAFPAETKADLDAHLTAIQEMEGALDLELKKAATNQPNCAAPAGSATGGAGNDFASVGRTGAAHLKIIATALACDITRVVTFQWATGASLLNFGSMGASNHHSTSHANSRGPLSAVDKWYSEQTAPFIRDLAATTDAGGGKLIDNTLVWYINEVSEGWSHSFDDYPFVFFGGDGVGLKTRSRVLDVSGRNFTSNDVWTSLAPAFGTTLTSFPTKFSGPIPGLFAA